MKFHTPIGAYPLAGALDSFNSRLMRPNHLAGGQGTDRQSARRRSTVTRRQVGALLGTAAIPLTSGCNSLFGGVEKRLLETYREGYAAYQSGTDLHNEAVIAYRSDAYTEVESDIEDALKSLTSARTSFESTRTMAADNDIGKAAQIAASAVEKTSLLIEASELLGDTARGFRTGNYEAAQGSYDDYRDRVREFERAEIYPPKVLGQQLDTGLLYLSPSRTHIRFDR